jgi:hypothetical protein
MEVPTISNDRGKAVWRHLGAFPLGDIALDGNKMRDSPCGLVNRRDPPLQMESRAILAIIDRFALECFPSFEISPKSFDDVPVGQGPLENPRCQTHHFARGVAGHSRKRWVCEDDSRPGQVDFRVGDQNGFIGLKHRGVEEAHQVWAISG